MNIFNIHCCEEDLKRVEILLEAQLLTLQRIEQLLTPHTASTVIVFKENFMASTPGNVAVGATLTGTIVPLEADGVTVTPGAVVSAQSWSIDQSNVATLVQNADGTATITGVANGTAQVTANATVTDADGTVSNFSATNTVTVTGGTPTERTAGIQINFA